jgi:glycogen debranching enzyme
MDELLRTVGDVSLLPKAPREWLVANGLGGYASATITGAITRRYHGFLIATQPAPLGRMVVLEDLDVDIEREDGISRAAPMRLGRRLQSTGPQAVGLRQLRHRA